MKRSDIILNSSAHVPARDVFAQALNAACGREGWRTGDCVRYFLDAAFRSMRGAVVFGQAREDNEREYMRIVDRCRHKESMTDLSRMLAATIMALEADPIDFIGPIFSEFAANAWVGQFFTPHHLSRALAEMSIDESPAAQLQASGKSYLLCSEPACGVGGMVLAAHEVMKARGLNPSRQAHWVMVDVDYYAMCGAYIQANLCGVSADVVHGNTLSLEQWMTTPTLAAILHPKLAHRRAHNLQPEMAEPKPVVEPPAIARRRKPISQMTFEFIDGGAS